MSSLLKIKSKNRLKRKESNSLESFQAAEESSKLVQKDVEEANGNAASNPVVEIMERSGSPKDLDAHAGTLHERRHDHRH